MTLSMAPPLYFVCAAQFGPGALPQHGFARNTTVSEKKQRDCALG